MKKGLSILLCAILLLGGLAGCTGHPATDNGKLNVVATIFPQYDFTRQIAGDKVNLSLLIPPGGESHTYEPTPQDIINIQAADIFIYVGGENDTWLDGILENVDTKAMTIISLLDCVQTLEEEIVEGMQAPGGHDHEEAGHDHGEEEPDEHVWTSPVNAKVIAMAITEALVEKDKDNADTYRANMAAYGKSLEVLDRQFRMVAQQAKTKELIFGDRFPLRYFAQEYGFTYYAAFPGCSAESEPSAKTIAFLIDKVTAEQVDTVFYIEFSNHLAADTIAQETGASIALFHSCHNVTLEEMEQGATYLSLMGHNLETLRAVLL